jgi:hypothetical protein
MKKDKIEKWIFAASHEGIFYPERLTDLGGLDNLEYADVRDGEYQLWHWPSGDTYKIIPDREVEPQNEYSLPYGKKEVIWLPILEKIGNNKLKVNEAMSRLDEPHSN